MSKTNWIIFAVMLLFSILFIFRERIYKTKIAKAKMEIFNTIIEDEPEEAKENIKAILDTLISQ